MLMAHFRRNNHWLTIDGETRLLTEWAESAGITQELVRYRLGRDWTIEDAVFTPPRRYARRDNDTCRTLQNQESA
jgi:hypothetical protein